MPGNLPSIADLLKRRQAAPEVALRTATPSGQEPVASPELKLQTPDSRLQTPEIPAVPPVQPPSTINPLPPTPPSVPESKKIILSDKVTSSKLSEKMGNIAFREKEDQTKKIATATNVPYIDLKGFPITADALTLLPEKRAQELQAIVFLYTGTELRVGAINPHDTEIEELVTDLGKRHKSKTGVYMISAEGFAQAMKMYATLPKIVETVKGVQITEKELEKFQASMKDVSSIAEVLKTANITDVLAAIIAASVQLESSDVHIEAEEKGIAVRFRVDGILQDVAELDRDKWKKMINRIKLIASLKLNVTDQAQDGRFTIFQKNKQIDVRTSTIPTSFGESVVMRLLNPDSISLAFEDLGFRAPMLKKLQKEIEKPNGMVITTGPTGSGKTTTLYAILKKLNTSDVKIITLEDPVEYKVEGINQSQIDYAKDYTFAKGLRSILRQDPDIVMVGEIRDLETAEIAIQAALTGHMMLSTIHTNDAAGAVPRFLSMGVKPFLLAPALNAIMGQRLLRKLCKACKKEVTIDAESLESAKKQLDAIPETSGEAKVDTTALKFFGPVGCTACNNTGYKGRVGAYEIIIRDEEIEQAILKGVLSEYDMRAIAQHQGMVTMTQDGLLKAVDGLTSVEEVKRIVGL